MADSINQIINEKNSFEECKVKLGQDWIPEYEQERSDFVSRYPFTIILEGDYLEFDMANSWCEKEIGRNGDEWMETWYDKIGYNYGLGEYFFKSQANLDLFLSNVDSFYSELNGKKWKTDGRNRVIDL